MFLKTIFCLACCFAVSSAILGPILDPVLGPILNPLLGLSSKPSDVKFYYFPTANVKTEIVYNNAGSFANSGFKTGVRTVLLIDGFLSNSTSPMSLTLKNGLLNKYGDSINLIVVDWGKLSGATVTNIFLVSNLAPAWYPLVIPNVPIAAGRVADFLNFIGVDMAQTHVIGHSLGAHIAGQSGALIKSRYQTSLKRISGLDPAGPLYEVADLPDNKRLSSSDASFVDAYHTDRGQLGTLDTNRNNVDVFVNGGGGLLLSQPGCALEDYNGTGVPGLATLTGFCSHSYSWRFYNAALSGNIQACPCDTSCLCQFNCDATCASPLIVVGEDISSSATGTYSITITDSFQP